MYSGSGLHCGLHKSLPIYSEFGPSQLNIPKLGNLVEFRFKTKSGIPCQYIPEFLNVQFCDAHHIDFKLRAKKKNNYIKKTRTYKHTSDNEYHYTIKYQFILFVFFSSFPFEKKNKQFYI